MKETEVITADHPEAMEHSLSVLKAGGLVAFPTDTVYGIGALAFRDDAVRRLYPIKGRNAQKAIAVLIAGLEILPQVAAKVSALALCLAERFWPGPLTLIVARHSSVPSAVSSLPTIGVRVPDHPVALKLLRLAGPLAVTSANLSGEPSLCRPSDVFRALGGCFELLLDGGVAPGGQPSTVVDCTGKEPVILREGPISMDELQSTLG